MSNNTIVPTVDTTVDTAAEAVDPTMLPGAILSSVQVSFTLEECNDNGEITNKTEHTIELEEVRMQRGRGGKPADTYYRPPGITSIADLTFAPLKWIEEEENAALQNLFKTWSKCGPGEDKKPDAATVARRMANAIMGKRERETSALGECVKRINVLKPEILKGKEKLPKMNAEEKMAFQKQLLEWRKLVELKIQLENKEQERLLAIAE